MTSNQSNPDLFWIAGCLVLMVLIAVAAKLFLSGRQRFRPGPWVVAAALVMPACTTAAPMLPTAPHDAGWSTPFAQDDLQRT